MSTNSKPTIFFGIVGVIITIFINMICVSSLIMSTDWLVPFSVIIGIITGCVSSLIITGTLAIISNEITFST